MKRLLVIAALIVVAGFQFLSAQSLSENSYYKRSLELRALASQAFDDGDYDAAADYAAQAQQNASLSDKYVEKTLAMTAADKSIAQAKAVAAKVEAFNAKGSYPTEYAAASGSLDGALVAYKGEDFGTAKTKADDATAAFNALLITMTAAYNAQLDAKAKADAALAAAKAAADAAITAAKARLAWADSIQAPKNWPAAYGKAKDEMGTALSSYSGEKYDDAKNHADAVLAALAAVTETLPFPATYTVRLIPARRDCLWRIAEYTFIYNNPLKWTVIYEANKKTFRDPSNPNLIFPGQVLQIPNIAGETRSGAWDPTKAYAVFPKK